MILPERLNYMTNPLIPNTFVPGTKAKAQEVNANFIALADEIQRGQTNTHEQFEQVRSEISEKMDYVSQNYAQTDLVNTNAITNTIIEAPNGVAEYNGQTVTIKSKVRFLIPNGKTSGNTLANIEYVTEEPITKTVTNLTDIDTAVFVDNTGNVEIIPQNHIFYKNTTPTTLEDNVHWYNTDENQWYKYISSESRWSEVFAIPIASASWDTNSVISEFRASTPINLIKSSDLNSFYTLRGVLPKDMDYVVERYYDVWATYTVYKSGWVKQTGYSDGKGDTYINFYIPMMVPYNISIARITSASNTNSVNYWVRNDVSTTYMKVYSPENAGKLWSVEGYRSKREEI